MRHWRKMLLAGILLGVVVSVGLWLALQLRIDSCLDRGGRWDHAADACVTG